MSHLRPISNHYVNHTLRRAEDTSYASLASLKLLSGRQGLRGLRCSTAGWIADAWTCEERHIPSPAHSAMKISFALLSAKIVAIVTSSNSRQAELSSLHIILSEIWRKAVDEERAASVAIENASIFHSTASDRRRLEFARDVRFQCDSARRALETTIDHVRRIIAEMMVLTEAAQPPPSDFQGADIAARALAACAGAVRNAHGTLEYFWM